jgi:hypothetical protein
MRREDIIIKRAMDYRERARIYLENFEEDRRRGDREKAGEALWGVVSCLINALHIIEEEKPASNHQKQKIFAQQFIRSAFEEGEELAKAYEYAERFHSNFYHAFLNDEEFERIGRDILRLAERLDFALIEKLRKLACS